MAGRRGPGSEEAPVAQPTNIPTPYRAGPATTTPRNPSSSLRVELSPSRPLPSPPWISVKPRHWHRARKTQDAAMGAPSTKRLQPQPPAPFPAPRLEPPPLTHGLPAESGKESPDPASRPPDPAPSRRIERHRPHGTTTVDKLHQSSSGPRTARSSNGGGGSAASPWPGTEELSARHHK